MRIVSNPTLPGLNESFSNLKIYICTACSYELFAKVPLIRIYNVLKLTCSYFIVTIYLMVYALGCYLDADVTPLVHSFKILLKLSVEN